MKIRLATPLLVFIVLSLAIPAVALDLEARTYYGHGSLTLPIGDFSDYAGIGIGGGGGMVVPFDQALTFKSELGLNLFSGKSFQNYDSRVIMIPLIGLASYQLDPEGPIYALGGFGLTMVHVSLDYPNNGNDSDNDIELTLTGGAGYKLNNQLAVEWRLTIISNSNYLSVNGVYHF